MADLEPKEISSNLFSYLCFLKLKRKKLTLKKFTSTFEVRQMIIISKDYRKLSCPTEFPLFKKTLMFAWCKNSKIKVEAQCVRFFSMEQSTLGFPFEIPEDYEGLFEIVPKEGDGLFRIHRVEVLAYYLNKPFMLMKSMSAFQRTTDGEWQICILPKGCKITVGEVVPDEAPLRVSNICLVLRCDLSCDGKAPVYLPVEETGDFALIGGPTGLQTISSLQAFEFPIDAKLVYGYPPPGAGGNKFFSPFMRLTCKGFDEYLTAWTMGEEPLIHIPIDSPMEVSILDNLMESLDHPFYEEIVQCVQAILQGTSDFVKPSNMQQLITSAISIVSSTTEIQQQPSAKDIQQPSTSYQKTAVESHQPSRSYKMTAVDHHQSSRTYKMTAVDHPQSSRSYKIPAVGHHQSSRTCKMTAVGHHQSSRTYKMTAVDHHQLNRSYKRTVEDMYQLSSSYQNIVVGIYQLSTPYQRKVADVFCPNHSSLISGAIFNHSGAPGFSNSSGVDIYRSNIHPHLPNTYPLPCRIANHTRNVYIP